MYFIYPKVKNWTALFKNFHRIIMTDITMENQLLNINEKLSSLVRPVNYKLCLQPDIDLGVFQGNVEITVDIKEEKNYLNLHSQFLNIYNVKVFKGNSEVPVSKFSKVERLEQLLIHFDDILPTGNYVLNIDFSGNLTRNIVGFYSSHIKNNGKMVASKFQPTYARQAFPCFDEPDFKATYDVTLVKPKTYIALSNMNEISKTENELSKENNTDSVTFARSVPMSTYLACFVICDFNFKETIINSNGIGDNFKLRSFAQKNQMHKIEFAQDIGKRATEFYINYYEVPFPLPKLDMIAIPDYVSGATEHWGLITYRETSFLIDESTASTQNKISVANTIAHELAHMWFGNLVTMKWWDEVWLNEGFASYMQVKSLNSIEPSWTMLDQFLPKTLHPVLMTDAKLSSHPIVQTVTTPDQITAIFDSISYNKGASVLRMLEGFIGEENFRRGISDYLKKHKYGNTVTQDLFSSLELYFKRDNPTLNIADIMGTWTRQSGYPVVSVTRVKGGRACRLTQDRFLLDYHSNTNNTDDSPYGYRWFIPITYKTNKGLKPKIEWFPNTDDSVEITLADDEEWLKINNNQVGYYRVNYAIDMWEDLIKAMKNKSQQLTISDRSHLINDAFALADARLAPYELALRLVSYLPKERDYVPWTTVSSIFAHLDRRLINTPTRDLFRKYVQSLVEPLYTEQSWEKGNYTVIQAALRSTILSLSTRHGLPDAVRSTRDRFSAWLAAQHSDVLIEPDLRDLVYYYGMKSATQEEWDKLWRMYLKEEDVQEQARLRKALAAPDDADILLKYLEMAWDERYVRGQDYLGVVQDVAGNTAGTAVAWSFVRERWPRLVERYTLNSRYLGNLVPALTATFNTAAQLKEVEEFFAKFPEAGAGEAARKRALETLRANIRWTNELLPAVHSWLTSQHL